MITDFSCPIIISTDTFKDNFKTILKHIWSKVFLEIINFKYLFYTFITHFCFKDENPKKSNGQHAKFCNSSSGSNPKAWSCEAPTLPTEPTCQQCVDVLLLILSGVLKVFMIAFCSPVFRSKSSFIVDDK